MAAPTSVEEPSVHRRTRQPTVGPSSKASWLRKLLAALVIGLVLSSRAVGLSPGTLWRGLGQIEGIGRRSLPPRWDDFGFDLSQGWLSFCMAVVATTIATVLALLKLSPPATRPLTRWSAPSPEP